MSTTYRDLEVWKRSMDLATEVYRETRGFPQDERFGLTSQIRGAAVSIPSNIAEGQGRRTRGEWRQLLGVANGSLFELETQIDLASRFGYLNGQRTALLVERATEVSRLLHGLIKFVERGGHPRSTK